MPMPLSPRTARRFAAATALASLFAAPAVAQSLDFSVGSSMRGPSEGTIFATLEYHAPDSFASGNWSGGWAGALRVSDDGDGWIGAGYALEYDLGANWYAQGSFMPGYYSAGGTALGHSIEFRTLIGIGYRFDAMSSIDLTLDHMSNAGLGSSNPGIEILAIGYNRRF
ncbi:acyloxyacyl hydrolase [Rhodobacter sp. NTK016B]|uniref:acyloxyacyl hydrolase n=1 Tax=Rhodobacter sp. NTK016B TaxID=2759676 RepID=UPI001A8FB5C2|nr:acyloxyacyl hydrolase [Rhodobacter sp. NTK016B]MBN8293949.1 acyloxyacyl hydrolase [Rhodobacter sp. NTK016B]